MHLLRKHPEKVHMQEMQDVLVGAIFTGSQQLDGKQDTLAIIDKRPIPNLQEIQLNNTGKYRYYQLFTTRAPAVNVAHLEFLGPASSLHTCISPTPLPIFYEGQPIHIDPLLVRIEGKPLKTCEEYLNSYDGNFDTFVGYYVSNHISMDFRQPVHISHIRLAPQNR